MQVVQTSSRDVQLLLWAVGEARERREEYDRGVGPEDRLPAHEPDFFTEWQPARN